MSKFVIPRRNSARGFTLLELLIVIAILGLIAAGVVLASQRMTASAAVSAAKSERQVLQKAVDAMMADKGVSVLDGVYGTDVYELGDVDQNQSTPPVYTVNIGGVPYDISDFLKREQGVKGHYRADTEGFVTCIAYPGLGAAEILKVNGS